MKLPEPALLRTLHQLEDLRATASLDADHLAALDEMIAATRISIEEARKFAMRDAALLAEQLAETEALIHLYSEALS